MHTSFPLLVRLLLMALLFPIDGQPSASNRTSSTDTIRTSTWNQTTVIPISTSITLLPLPMYASLRPMPLNKTPLPNSTQYWRFQVQVVALRTSPSMQAQNTWEAWSAAAGWPFPSISPKDHAIAKDFLSFNRDRFQWFFYRAANPDSTLVSLTSRDALLWNSRSKKWSHAVELSIGEDGFLEGGNLTMALDPHLFSAGMKVALTLECQSREYPVHVDLIGARGISVILDVDETLKYFGYELVSSVRQFLFRPYAPIEGMVEAVQRMQNQLAAVNRTDLTPPSFHYLSAAPWQMIPSQQDFFQDVGYPRGPSAIFRCNVWNVKQAWESMTSFVNMGALKHKYLDSLLQEFPERQFILVGDSAIHDPRAYGDLMRTFGTQRIPLALIRKVPMVFPYSLKNRMERFLKAFRHLPRSSWVVFENPSDIPSLKIVTSVA